jgi:hypothetical protein
VIRPHEFKLKPREGHPRNSRFPQGGDSTPVAFGTGQISGAGSILGYADFEGVANSFDLQINDTSGLTEPWPMIVGLPFPEGKITDAALIRIMDNVTQVPAQFDVAATWPDGSLRWVHAGFTANPQNTYRCEYNVSAAPTNAGLTVTSHAGGITVNTGAAVYEFVNDRLLPDNATIGSTDFLADSGDGAYLVDNQGRLGRVAGAAAQITNTIVKQGHARAVLLREGLYVTSGNVVLAKAQAWFYFSAGSPYMKVTHSLIFTVDTNTLWVKDYGLEFKTPTPLTEATFAVGTGALSMTPVNASTKHNITDPGSNEVFMLQDDFPHFLERTSVAVVGSSTPLNLGGGGSFSSYTTLHSPAATGDWGDGKFGDYGLTVVMPWMAQRFPKDITFGLNKARAAFWSNRSGRELDFRVGTLIDEYWQSWTAYSQDSESTLRGLASNAQGAARTHDLWLLPRTTTNLNEATAKAASQPPLMLADPVWSTATEAIGWPMHPLDTENFPQEEATTSDLYNLMMTRHENTRYTGFIAFGKPPRMYGSDKPWFRLYGSAEYKLRKGAWGLYVRSGDRRYYNYATGFSRFHGDWMLVHEAAPNKYKGEMAQPPTGDPPFHRPLYWGSRSTLQAVYGDNGHSVSHWTLHYYLTGDERALEAVRLHGDALKARFSVLMNSKESMDGPSTNLATLAELYEHYWDETFATLAKTLADWWVDLTNSPNGINDAQRFGALYKEDRDHYNMYVYQRGTGDERAREGFLRGVEYQYRFNRIGAPYDQHIPSWLYAVAYHMTGDSNYLRVLHDVSDRHRRWNGTTAGIYQQMNSNLGIPVALGALLGTEPVTMYPLVRQYNANNSKILLRKAAGQSVEVRAHVRIHSDLAESTPTSVSVLAPDNSSVSGLNMQSETMFNTVYATRRDLRRRAVSLTIPAQNPAGIYTLEFPNTVYADVLDTTALTTVVYAPNGHRLYVDRIFFFWVPEGTTTLQLSLSAGTEVRRPNGTVVGANLNGTQNIAVSGNTGAWSVVSTNNSIVQLLNVEPIFSREPTYVAPWEG